MRAPERSSRVDRSSRDEGLQLRRRARRATAARARRRRLEIDAEILRRVAPQPRDRRVSQGVGGLEARPLGGPWASLRRRSASRPFLTSPGASRRRRRPPASQLSAGNPSDSSVRPIESTLGRASGNSSTVAIWLSASGCRPSFESASACSRSGRARCAYSARRRLIASFSLSMRWRVFTSCSEA